MREGEGRGGERGEEALLVMWPTKLSALNPPVVKGRHIHSLPEPSLEIYMND